LIFDKDRIVFEMKFKKKMIGFFLSMVLDRFLFAKLYTSNR